MIKSLSSPEEYLAQANITNDVHMVVNTQSGGVIICTIVEVLDFIHDLNHEPEKTYLDVMSKRDLISKESLESLIRHFLFFSKTAKNYLSWKKSS